MIRVKILLDKDPQNTTESIKDIFVDQKINCQKIYLNKHKQQECIVICNSPENADKIFTEPCINKLNEIGSTPVLSEELKAYRSVILRNCSDDIYNNDVNTIIEEIHNNNYGIKIQDVFKFPNTKTLKITCASHQMQQRLCNNNVLLFRLSIPVSEEIYVNIKVCLKCYAMDSHETNNCPQGQEFKICSNCASTNHTHKECKSPTQSCIHCHGNHSSMAYSCPERKKLIKMKHSMLIDDARSNTSTRRSTSSYPEAVRRNSPNISQRQQQQKCDQISKDTLATMAIVFATLKNMESPGSFETVLVQLLIDNKLPLINTNNISAPNFSSILSHITTSSNNNNGSPSTACADSNAASTTAAAASLVAPVSAAAATVAAAAAEPVAAPAAAVTPAATVPAATVPAAAAVVCLPTTASSESTNTNNTTNKHYTNTNNTSAINKQNTKTNFVQNKNLSNATSNWQLRSKTKSASLTNSQS